MKMGQYFRKPYEPFGGNISIKVDLANYATKIDIKNILHIHTSSFALKSNLACLKTEVDKLDIDKLVPISVDLGKLSDLIKNDAVKKAVHDKLVEKVNNIDTSRFVLKIKNDLDKVELENKIPDTIEVVKKLDYNSKSTEITYKIPNISGLATKATLTAVENKMPIISSLVKKQIATQKLLKLKKKKKMTVMIMINILLVQTLINFHEKILIQD